MQIDLNFENTSGWILANGEFYGCERTQHITIAKSLRPASPNPELTLENEGAIKLSSSKTGLLLVHSGRTMQFTKEQKSTLFKFCEKYEYDYCHIITSIESRGNASARKIKNL